MESTAATHRQSFELENHVSELKVRTIDGMRVALAGLSPTMPVSIQAPLVAELTNVVEARAILQMPCRLLGIRIPYRLTPESVVQFFDADDARPINGTTEVPLLPHSELG